MQIIVDSTTDGVELYHLSVLFQSLAGARGFAVPVQEYTVGVDITQVQAETAVAARVDNLNTVINAAGETLGSVDLSKPDSVEKSGDGLSYGYTITPPVTVVDIDPPVTNDNLDSEGLPWDPRIHSGSRERNTDGSWRVRRRPKGVEEADWEATLARVTAELRDLMEIPVSPGAVADAAADTALTDAEVDAFVGAVQGVTADANDHGYQVVQEPINADHASVDDAGTVTVHVAPPVTIAPPVVVPPVTAVAPPIATGGATATASPAIETFPQVMVWLTAHTPKDEAAKPGMVTRVNEILSANGLTVLQQLNQRPELIPQIMEQFIEAFGV